MKYAILRISIQLRIWYKVCIFVNEYEADQSVFSIPISSAYYLYLSTATELDITLHRKISKNLRIHRSDLSLCIAVINMEEQSRGSYRIYSIPIISQRAQHKLISTDGYLSAGAYVILPLLFNPTNKTPDNTDFTIGEKRSLSREKNGMFFSLL